MQKKYIYIITGLALVCLGYFIYELFALDERTSLGYAMLFAGVALNLILTYIGRNKKKET